MLKPGFLCPYASGFPRRDFAALAKKGEANGAFIDSPLHKHSVLSSGGGVTNLMGEMGQSLTVKGPGLSFG